MDKIFSVLLLALTILITGCIDRDRGHPQPMTDIIVNTLNDTNSTDSGEVSLRVALQTARSGQRIVFDSSLDGSTIDLLLVDEEHSILPGEVMGMRNEPSGPVSYLEGYFERDYGRSALYARKNVIIDASDLSLGITLAWAGGNDNPARVLAVYGDLTLINVSITGGQVIAEDISASNAEQPWTLARGGGLAVWGVARLEDCQIFNNHLQGDFDSSRDRGAFGGGVYANIIQMENCVVGGNSVLGAGAAGGGVFSVGGADHAIDTSTIDQSAITGNRINGLFAYGGGVYSDGGGIGNRNTLAISNTTIARNLVDAPPGMPAFLLGMGYWRGGGVYMSNGYLEIISSTIVENEVSGTPRTDSLGKPNLAGGIAATIGNAHAVEEMRIGQSIVAGNRVNPAGGASYSQDIFTGSLLHYKSRGYNLIGTLDFSQILVPVGEREWESLSRRHFPKAGDVSGVVLADIIDLNNGVNLSDDILSVGVDASNPVVIHYLPQASALDQIPGTYSIDESYLEYHLAPGGADNFLQIVLQRIEDEYNLAGFANSFTGDFENFLQTVDADNDTAGVQPYTDPSGNLILTLADTQWFGPAVTWPKELENYPYIEFWHQLDNALQAQNIPALGQELLNDDAWLSLFSAGPLSENGDITMYIVTRNVTNLSGQSVDQIGMVRSASNLTDIGAIEVP